ncbi:MAG: vitamin K epoxide reductase family protein [Bacteroidota bacterium]
MIPREIVFVLSIVGLSISLYFTLLYYRIISPEDWFVPRWCRMDSNTCGLIIHARQARAFGLPNSVLGVVFYLCTAFYAIGGTGFIIQVLDFMIIYISAAALLVSIYLFYNLRRRLRVDCVLCYLCQGINVVLFIIFLTAS